MRPDIRTINAPRSSHSRHGRHEWTRLVVVMVAVWALGALYVVTSRAAALSQDPAPGAAVAALPAQGAARTVWMGVYGAEQAKRGEKVAADACSPCHGPELTGGEVGPSLVGADFLTTWNDLTVWDLFDRIHTTMPMEAPGSLSVPSYGDVVAYILSRNKFPAGTTDLSTEDAALRSIKITSQP